MSTSAKVVVLDGAEGLSVHNVQLPEPGPYEVIVEQYAAGVCHSQLHNIHARPPGAKMLGHESSGWVVKAGESVTHVQVGDDVIITWVPRLSGGSTRMPAPINVELEDGRTATPATLGVFTWGTHALVDEQYVVKAPDGMPRDTGSVIGCAVMTGAGAVVNTAAVPPGSSVAVWGAGGVGLSAIAAARVAGAAKVIAVDIDDAKLEVARRFGATDVINSTKDDPVAAVKALTTQAGTRNMYGQPFAGADYNFDCLGRQITFSQAFAAAKTQRGGTTVLVGVPTDELRLDGIDLLASEKTLLGSVGGSSVPDRDFPIFVQWNRDGLLDLDSLVTARFSLDQIGDAVADLEAGKVLGRAILEFTSAGPEARGEF